MKAIKEILEKSLKQLNLESVSQVSHLQIFWERLVGPMIAKNSEPVSLKGGLLTVWVKSPTWASELSLMKPEILRKVRETEDAANIKDIRFVLQKLPPLTKGG